MTNKELTKIREEKNMTKGQFAALIGISPMMQGRYEGGKVKIPEDVVEKVMKLGEKEKVKVEKKVTRKKTEKKTKKKTPEKKTTKATTTKKTSPTIHIQSMLGGTITIEEIKKRIPADAESVYVKPEENKAYWVKGEETGDVDLW
jgi:transcriptional regulator with XRE-family HTH domain